MEGLVLQSTGLWYRVRLDGDQEVTARLRRKIRLQGLRTTNPIAVGDRVKIEEDKTHDWVISDILPRRNYVARKAVKLSSAAHLLAANVDQLVVLASLKSPVTRLGFVDRLLVSAEAFRIPALILWTKTDLLDATERKEAQALADQYEEIGYPAQLLSLLDPNVKAQVGPLMAGKTSLVAGHSGVGKSTLLNCLNPDLKLKTGDVSDFNEKGKHTTTFAELYTLSKDTHVIDSPGIKELGLHDIGEAELPHYFPEMRERIGDCRFHNCKHLREPGCAIIAAVGAGEISGSRYRNYLRMLEGEEE